MSLKGSETRESLVPVLKLVVTVAKNYFDISKFMHSEKEQYFLIENCIIIL